jgi:hypothetical protein
VPPMVFMFLEQRSFWTLFGIVFCIFTLIGPLFGHPDHNIYRYLLAPLVCPIAPALYFVLKPFNPYKGPAARLSGMTDRDKSDQDAKCLVQLFRSKEAQRFIWRTTAKISGVLFLLMSIMTTVVRDSLNWSFSSRGLGPGLMGCVLGSFIALGAEYVGWSLTTWARRDAH